MIINSLGNDVLVDASGDKAALTLLLVGLAEPLPSESLEILRRRVAEQKVEISIQNKANKIKLNTCVGNNSRSSIGTRAA